MATPGPQVLDDTVALGVVFGTLLDEVDERLEELAALLDVPGPFCDLEAPHHILKPLPELGTDPYAVLGPELICEGVDLGDLRAVVVELGVCQERLVARDHVGRYSVLRGLARLIAWRGRPLQATTPMILASSVGHPALIAAKGLGGIRTIAFLPAFLGGAFGCIIRHTKPEKGAANIVERG